MIAAITSPPTAASAGSGEALRGGGGIARTSLNTVAVCVIAGGVIACVGASNGG